MNLRPSTWDSHLWDPHLWDPHLWDPQLKTLKFESDRSISEENHRRTTFHHLPIAFTQHHISDRAVSPMISSSSATLSLSATHNQVPVSTAHQNTVYDYQPPREHTQMASKLFELFQHVRSCSQTRNEHEPHELTWNTKTSEDLRRRPDRFRGVCVGSRPHRSFASNPDRFHPLRDQRAIGPVSLGTFRCAA